MRKSKIKIADIDEKIINIINNEPPKFFSNLEELSITVPEWSKLVFITFALDKTFIEVAFFEEAKDFFLSYTKKTLRNEDDSSRSICFSREASEEWKFFVPPTLIGANLTTKLRKKP